MTVAKKIKAHIHENLSFLGGEDWASYMAQGMGLSSEKQFETSKADEATSEMVVAAQAVEWDLEDEVGTIKRIWRAMTDARCKGGS